MKLVIGSLLLLLCLRIVKANAIPEGQSVKDEMPSVYPKVYAVNYSYITTGAYIYNDCTHTTVGNLRDKGLLRFDNIDIGPDSANTIRIHFSNQSTGTQTMIRVYTEHPSIGGFIGSVKAKRTDDWCDLTDNTGTIVVTSGVISTLYLEWNTDVSTSAGCDLEWFSFERN
ncbi:hypothetical protein CHUAL_008835 [Chamberlinius hualienensis]